MKFITLTFLTAAVALSLIGCGAPANNAPVMNTSNTNTAKAPSAPTAADLLALDKGANEAYFKGDAKYFETFLSDKAGGAMNGKHQTKADILKEIGTAKCDMKSWDVTEPQMSQIDADTYVLSYKGTYDGTCTENGKSVKVPPTIRAATVYVRNADKWQAAWHEEVAMMEPKDDKSANTKPDAKKDEKADTKKDDAKKDDAAKPAEKKDEKADAKKDDAKKDDKAPASNSAANTAPAAEMKPDANTDALMKIETAGWMAWKDKDAKALDAMAAKNLAAVDPSGKWFGTRADVLKSWDGSNCSGITKVDLKNGFAWALSPTVEILTFDSTTDGTCDGMKNGLLHGSSVYVKEGSDWKIAFAHLSPPPPHM